MLEGRRVGMRDSGRLRWREGWKGGKQADHEGRRWEQFQRLFTAKKREYYYHHKVYRTENRTLSSFFKLVLPRPGNQVMS